MRPEIKLNNRSFNFENPLIIAEIGCNHKGDLGLCKKIIKEANEAGVDAVKLQKRNNKILFTKSQYEKIYNSENSFGKTYGEHREKLEFNKSQFLEIKKFTEGLGMIFFATPFDIPSAHFLNDDVDIPLFKISSSDVENKPLIDTVLNFKKPIIVSTGFSDMNHLDKLYKYIKLRTNNFCFLQCTASYPCKVEDLNLNVLKVLKKKFKDILVGLSSHHNGYSTETIAYMLGARVFEKHFTIDRTMKGTDQAFSLSGSAMKRMVRDIKRIEKALGNDEKKKCESEIEPMQKMKKSLVFLNDKCSGSKILKDDIGVKCAGDFGISPWDVDKVIGKKLLKEVKSDTVIKTTHFKK